MDAEWLRFFAILGWFLAACFGYGWFCYWIRAKGDD